MNFKIKSIYIVQFCYNFLIPLQILVALWVDAGKYVESALLICLLMLLESIGIKYWILAQTENLNGVK